MSEIAVSARGEERPSFYALRQGHLEQRQLASEGEDLRRPPGAGSLEQRHAELEK